MVRTPRFQCGNTGSIPVGATDNKNPASSRFFVICNSDHGIERVEARREVFAEAKTSWRASADFRRKSAATQGKESSPVSAGRDDEEFPLGLLIENSTNLVEFFV